MSPGKTCAARLTLAATVAVGIAGSGGVLAAGDCWLDIYERTDFTGAHVRIEGPAELASLRNLNGENWGNRIESLMVGPKAQIQAFRSEGFKEEPVAQPYHGEAIQAWKEKPESLSDQQITFGPGKKAHHLGELGFHHNINSLKIGCMP
jgi:hypothetical protein